MKKILTYAGIFVLLGLFVYISFYKLSINKLRQSERSATEEKQENKPITESVVQDNEPYFDEALNIDGVKNNLANEDVIYRIMHEMANTKVIADVKYAAIDITPNRINALIKAVNRSNWSDKSRLLEILNRWKQGDFSQAVEDHNYVWSKLGGEAGKATELKK